MPPTVVYGMAVMSKVHPMYHTPWDGTIRWYTYMYTRVLHVLFSRVVKLMLELLYTCTHVQYVIL